jgi:tRNA-dihydrouridine synthase A
MLDWTDRHCRFFHRLLSQKALLYSEMVTTGAILHGDRDRLLGFNPVEKPLVLQIGGSDPLDLAASARIGQDYGYDEINLNVGCPSDRVQKGRFGACLMLEPETVAEGVRAMREAVTIPVTVKTRLGVDENDSYEELVAFISRVAEAGCETFIIHARKAWLKGLSPRENREVPPLRYDMAARLKADFPELAFILNGGIETLDAAMNHLGQFDGVMLGRAAYHDPYLLAEVDQRVFGAGGEPMSREAVVEAMVPYIDSAVAQGQRLHGITRHMLGLFHGQHGGRIWRRRLGEAAIRPNAGARDVLEILASRQPLSREAEAGLRV